MPDKTVIVTGGERGIGLAITRHLLTLGQRVVIAGVQEEHAAKVLPELEPLGTVRFIKCDVTVEAEVQAMVAAVLAEFGTLTGLVNNAGLAEPEVGPVEGLARETWDLYLSVNLTGPFLCAKHCLPALRKSRGAIVNISSTRAHASEPNTEPYAATKAGLLGLNHALAVSCGPDVRVNAICPGWILTGSCYEPTEIEHANQLTGKVGAPEEVATVAAFLLDNAQSSFITGQSIDVDGGVSVKLGYVPDPDRVW